MCFFLSHSFVALAVCFGSLSCWNTHPRPIFNALAGFNALALTVHGPFHRPFDAVQLSCPLSRKTHSKHNVSTSMFDGGDGVLGVIGSILHEDLAWRDLAWSPSPREIDSYLVFFPFANNRTNCCHLLTKLLSDGLVAHSSLCRSTILSLTSLDSSLVLVMVESLESD